FDLRGTWKRRGKEAIRLDDKHPGVLVPGFPDERRRMLWLAEPIKREETTYNLNTESDGRLRRGFERQIARELTWETDDRRNDQSIGDRWSLPEVRDLDVLWGAEGSGVFIMRLRDPD